MFIWARLRGTARLRNTSESPEPGAGFGAIVFHKNFASQEILKEVASMLTTFATEYGGRYDGWERLIIRE